MKRSLFLLGFAPLLGCGEDLVKTHDALPDISWGDVGTDGKDTETTSTDDTADTADTGQDVSPLTGVNTSVTVTTPTPNPSCDASVIDRGPFGATYPWGGLTIRNKTYTCNKCPGGLRDFQGRWRAHGFTFDGDSDYSLGADAGPDDAELLYIDGNTFYSKIYDRQENVTVELRGWFFCGQKPEQGNEHLFWVVLDASPSGTLGYTNGTILESDVILSRSNDRKLITWLDDIGASTSVSLGYCQIGTSAGGQLCNDPFAQ